MSFDWVDFLERHGIEYVTQSPNIGRGELGIKCPLCGPSDPSQHMSINPGGRGWVCRRDRRHHGVSPVRLIQALLGCSAQEAARLVGRPLLPGAADVLSQVESLVGPSRDLPSLESPRPLREPHEFRVFSGKPSERPYMRYMVGRGFSKAFVRRASAEMGLRYCVHGRFGGRVMFLVHREGRLVNWTGRSISSRAKRRYQAHTPDPELAAEWGLEPADASIEGCLLWYDDLMAGGRELMVVEGPMDALKLRMLGCQATCLFTNTLSDGQVSMLRELAPRFERRIIMLDRGAEAAMMVAVSRLAALGFRPAWLPAGVGDPGELTQALRDQIGY